MQFGFAMFLTLSHGLWRRDFTLHNSSPKRVRLLPIELAFAGLVLLRQQCVHGGENGIGKFNLA
jgi:hypothetical protein